MAEAAAAFASLPDDVSVYQALKRPIDTLFAVVGLVILAPVLLGIGACILLFDGRPVFYRGVRTGLHGRTFRIFKFRTMVKDAERVGGGSTGAKDVRITPPGRWLRRHKLDELPQLLNVLRGDMSIVGPRPELPVYTNMYSERERVILSVRPGITDFASVEFIQLGEVLGSADPDAVYEREVMPRKNALRVKYVEKQSFRTDMYLIGRTVGKLFAKGRDGVR